MLLGLGLFAGFVVVLSISTFVNKAGDYLYRRGIAKPFYLRGYRVHHRKFLTAFVPAFYVAVATLIFLHFARVLWGSLWPSVEITVFLAAFCLTLDFTLDWLTTAEKRMNLVLHHEWLYFVLPAYIFTHMVVLV